MAHSTSTRYRAEQLYLGGWSLARIAAEIGPGRATLARWATAGDWRGKRERHRRLEAASAELVIEMTAAARESRDPQQAYAALQAARLAGLAEVSPIHPAPAEVVKAMLAVLARHPDLGALIRRHRKEVVEMVTRELERVEGAA